MKKLGIMTVLLMICSLAHASDKIGEVKDVKGKVFVNKKPAQKKLALFNGDKILIQPDSFLVVLYNSGNKELLRKSGTLNRSRIEKYLAYQEGIERRKNTLGNRNAEAVPDEKMTEYEKQQEKLRIFFNNSEYEELIAFVEESGMNYNHPDNLYKVALSCFRAGDLQKAIKHLKKLKSYDIPEYEDYVEVLYAAALYLSEDKDKNYYKSLLGKESENKLIEDLKIFND